MPDDSPRILLIGYGNVGRGDDGLGPAVADAVAGWGLRAVETETAYQLQVEDGLTLAEYDIAILADASASGSEPYAFDSIEPTTSSSFTTHALSPQAVLAVAHDLFGASTHSYLLAIRGYDFDRFDETLSASAKRNLAAALEFLEPLLRGRNFDHFAEAARTISMTPAQT